MNAYAGKVAALMRKFPLLMIVLLVVMVRPVAAQTTLPPDAPLLVPVGPLGTGAPLDLLVLDDGHTLVVLSQSGISYYDLSADDIAATERFAPLEQPIPFVGSAGYFVGEPNLRQVGDQLVFAANALRDDARRVTVDMETNAQTYTPIQRHEPLAISPDGSVQVNTRGDDVLADLVLEDAAGNVIVTLLGCWPSRSQMCRAI